MLRSPRGWNAVWPLFAVLLLLVVAAAKAASSSPAPKPATVRLVAIGDFGVGGASQAALGAAVQRFARAKRPQGLVTTGDNDYFHDPELFRSNWRASFGWLAAARVRVHGALGNHDIRVAGGSYQFATLGMPGRYYSRRIGDVQLVVLDSNNVDSAQTAFLARALSVSKARWRIVVFHHPAYTCGKYGGHPEVVSSWVRLFERYRVRLVLSGHDHNYQRFAPRNGVTYVVHGAGSTTPYTLVSCPAGYPRRVAGRTEQGFFYLVAGRTSLQGFAVDVEGRTRDRFTIGR